MRGLAASVALVSAAMAAVTALGTTTASAETAPKVPIEGVACGFDGTVTPRTVRLGDHGPAVREARCLLDFWGYIDFSWNDEIHGTFDADVEEAVKNFEKRRGLPVDGVVGPETWEELRHSLGAPHRPR
ncbi:peptidoglycan-binding domain-containing protein [Streptomyces violascens]|uniref:peptidoglycan-binding domain-containing protein n=1 Tax=Streptomyces violascens TaxID=67381 RepID=UPI00365F249D